MGFYRPAFSQVIIYGSGRKAIGKKRAFRNATGIYMKGSEIIIFIQGGPVRNLVSRAVNAVGHIIFPGIYKFYRCSYSMRNNGSFYQKIPVKPTAKSTSHAGHLYIYIFKTYSQAFTYTFFSKLRGLNRPQQFCFLIGNIGKKVHGFHAVMSKERTGI